MIYTIENNTSTDKAITVEAAILHDWEVFDTAQPVSETASERRWRVEVAAMGSVEFIQRRRKLTARRNVIRNLTYQRLEQYLKERILSEELAGVLGGILDLLQQKDDAEATIKKLSKERAGVHKQREQLRANLGALQPTGQEATLRNRLLKQLETTQDRLDAIAEETAALEADIQAAEEQVTRQTEALLDEG